MDLKSFFRENPKVALGFSGGTDSAYLLYAAQQYGAQVQPYFIRTPFQPAFEYMDAMRLCAQLGIELKTVDCNILSEDHIAGNPQNRCYFCKKVMFASLKKQAEADGYSLIIDGTNSSDDAGDRPGMQAIRELGVCSPLRECGITKTQVRDLSEKAGLFTWNKPAYACLATRVPPGIPITRDLLKRIEQSENILMDMGFSDFRVRFFAGAALLQVRENQLKRAAECREEILEKLRPYFDAVFLDLKIR